MSKETVVYLKVIVTAAELPKPEQPGLPPAMEGQWKPGILVYTPGTAYDGTAPNAYKPYWQRIKSTKWIEGEGRDGSGGWLEITFVRQVHLTAILPGEAGYWLPIDCLHTDRLYTVRLPRKEIMMSKETVVYLKVTFTDGGDVSVCRAEAHEAESAELPTAPIIGTPIGDVVGTWRKPHGFSTKLARIAKELGISTAEELYRTPRKKVAKIRSAGRGTLEEIDRSLSKLGLEGWFNNG